MNTCGGFLCQAEALKKHEKKNETQTKVRYSCFKISVQTVSLARRARLSLGKTSYNTCRGHKRSSGHGRYPFPIQASLSCFASSKGHPKMNTLCEQALREYLGLPPKVYVLHSRGRHGFEKLR